MTDATLTINSRNYGAWSLRGWLLCSFAGLDTEVAMVPRDDPSWRAELLLLSPSFLVPKLEHQGTTMWDTLAIAEYLNEVRPRAGLLPTDPGARAHCRSISGEMHAGFQHLRSALPMNLRAQHDQYKIWSGAQADIDRILEIWSDCFDRYGGPYLFGAKPTMADAMYAPVVARFRTYCVEMSSAHHRYCDTVLALPAMQAWIEAAIEEPDDDDELDAEF